MGVEQPLFSARRAAQRGPTRELRDGGRNGPGERAAVRRHAADHGHRQSAGERASVVRVLRARLVFHLPGGEHRGNKPRSLRHARGRIRTGGGYMTEFSGFRWALYFLAEYANMVVVASVATTLFLGGWLRPFSGLGGPAGTALDLFPVLILLALAGYCGYRAPKQPVRVQQLVMFGVAGLCALFALVLAAPLFVGALAGAKAGIHGAFWFFLKVSAYIYLFMWLRFTLPRYRFDQLMRLGWHFLIPLSIVNVMLLGLAIVLSSQYGVNRALAIGVMNLITLLFALYLVSVEKGREARKTAQAADQVTDSYAG